MNTYRKNVVEKIVSTLEESLENKSSVKSLVEFLTQYKEQNNIMFRSAVVDKKGFIHFTVKSLDSIERPYYVLSLISDLEWISIKSKFNYLDITSTWGEVTRVTNGHKKGYSLDILY